MKLLCMFLFFLCPGYSTRILPKKLCKDCKFFIGDQKTCAIFGETNVINGENDYEYALTVRNNNEKCGTDAKYFEENMYKIITLPYYFLKEYWLIFATITLYLEIINNSNK